MDNASKAIIMAGAVLIAIGLVGLGVYLFQSSTRLVDTENREMENRRIMSVNATFTKFEGACMGVDVKSLLGTVQTYNSNVESDNDVIKVIYGSYEMVDTTNVSVFQNAKQYNVKCEYNSLGRVNIIKVTDA